METFLGIDGGGSNTRALLVDKQGVQLHFIESGPTNLNVVSEECVRTTLEELVDSCISATDVKPSAACFGLAGSGSKKISEPLTSMIKQFAIAKSILKTDAEIALEGAFSGRAGLLLIAGTGSVCLGKTSDGRVTRTGGWGWLADDVGSAGWIGQRAIQFAVRQHDGRLSGSMIKDAIFEALNIHNESEIVSRIYQSGLSRADIARLAPLLLQLAECGDPSSANVRETALNHLEVLIRTTSKKMKLSTAKVALVGGLIEQAPAFKIALEDRLPDFEIQAPESTPVRGATSIARKLGITESI